MSSPGERWHLHTHSGVMGSRMPRHSRDGPRPSLTPPRDSARPASGLRLNPPVSGLETRAISHSGNPKLMRKKDYYFQSPHRPPTFPHAAVSISVCDGCSSSCACGRTMTRHAHCEPGHELSEPASPGHGHPSTAPLCPLLINTVVSPITFFFQMFFSFAPSKAFSPCGTMPELQLLKVLTRYRTASVSCFVKSRTLPYGNVSVLSF